MKRSSRAKLSSPVFTGDICNSTGSPIVPLSPSWLPLPNMSAARYHPGTCQWTRSRLRAMPISRDPSHRTPSARCFPHIRGSSSHRRRVVAEERRIGPFVIDARDAPSRVPLAFGTLSSYPPSSQPSRRPVRVAREFEDPGLIEGVGGHEQSPLSSDRYELVALYGVPVYDDVRLSDVLPRSGNDPSGDQAMSKACWLPPIRI